MITEEILLNNGWERQVLFGGKLIEYEKEINGFYYTIRYEKDNNWFDWRLHIDNPDRESVASLEISSLEHIDLISKIYKSA